MEVILNTMFTCQYMLGRSYWSYDESNWLTVMKFSLSGINYTRLLGLNLDSSPRFADFLLYIIEETLERLDTLPKSKDYKQCV